VFLAEAVSEEKASGGWWRIGVNQTESNQTEAFLAEAVSEEKASGGWWRIGVNQTESNR
jgi:hypothetical protein